MPEICTLPPCHAHILAYILTSSTDLEASTFLTFPILSYKSMIGLVDCRYVWILRKSTGRKKTHYKRKISRERTRKAFRTVPLLQALPVIVAPTAALASLKTAADTDLQKTSQAWLQPGAPAAILRAQTNKNPANLNWPGTQNTAQIWWM